MINSIEGKISQKLSSKKLIILFNVNLLYQFMNNMELIFILFKILRMLLEFISFFLIISL